MHKIAYPRTKIKKKHFLHENLKREGKNLWMCFQRGREREGEVDSQMEKQL